jgi:hypothetical protein
MQLIFGIFVVAVSLGMSLLVSTSAFAGQRSMERALTGSTNSCGAMVAAKHMPPGAARKAEYTKCMNDPAHYQ